MGSKKQKNIKKKSMVSINFSEESKIINNVPENNKFQEIAVENNIKIPTESKKENSYENNQTEECKVSNKYYNFKENSEMYETKIIDNYGIFDIYLKSLENDDSPIYSNNHKYGFFDTPYQNNDFLLTGPQILQIKTRLVQKFPEHSNKNTQIYKLTDRKLQNKKFFRKFDNSSNTKSAIKIIENINENKSNTDETNDTTHLLDFGQDIQIHINLKLENGNSKLFRIKCDYNATIDELKQKILSKIPFDSEKMLIISKNRQIIDSGNLLENKIYENSLVNAYFQNIHPICTKFETFPRIKNLTNNELKNIQDFTIFNEFGKIKFIGNTDIRGLNIDQIISIEKCKFSIYESYKNLPKFGTELNKLAIISLFNCFPKDLRKLTDAEYLAKFEENLKEQTIKQGGEFIEYNSHKGIWTFYVKHF